MVINPIRSLRVTRTQPPSSCFARERVSQEKGQPIAIVSPLFQSLSSKPFRTVYITCRASHQPRPFRAIDFSPQSRCSHFCISALSTFRGPPTTTHTPHTLLGVTVRVQTKVRYSDDMHTKTQSHTTTPPVHSSVSHTNLFPHSLIASIIL